MFYKQQAEIEKSSDNFLRNARKRDSQGRTLDAKEIRGKKPKATPGTQEVINQKDLEEQLILMLVKLLEEMQVTMVYSWRLQKTKEIC